jgi:hypothetical protein
VLPWARVVWLATVAAALTTGYIGIRAFVLKLPPGHYGTRAVDILYDDLQLFVLSSNPLNEPGPYPLFLEFARFAAPAATAYALIEASHALFASRYRQWRLRWRAGNTIIVGSTAAAEVLAARLAGTGRRIVRLPSGDAESLRDAGAARAVALYAFADDAGDPVVNLATAASAAGIGTRRVYAQVSDPALALALRARRLALPTDDERNVDVVHLDEVAARALARAEGSQIAQADAGTIVVVGTGAFGRALVVELARCWRLSLPRRTDRLHITLVGLDAHAVAVALPRQWPVVAAVCDLAWAEQCDQVPGPVPYRVYICDDDEHLALTTALTATGLWNGGAGSLVVRLNRLGSHGAVFADGRGRLLDGIGDRLRLVGLTELASDPDLIGEDLVERLAQVIHERYLMEQRELGASLGANALTQWDDLDEGFRTASRRQARDIGRKLEMIGCTVAPNTPSSPPISLDDTEIDMLAKYEHDRWCDERTAAGWQFGTRNDEARSHHDLVSWEDLGEPARNKDRQAVRDLPSIVGEIGLTIVRFAAQSSLPTHMPAGSEGEVSYQILSP